MIALDDSIDEHPKFIGLSDLAFGLWVRCVGYCRRLRTDGFIPTAAANARTRTLNEYQDPIGELLATAPGCTDPLWHEVPGGYQIHDYLAWNPSREEVEARTEQRREAGRVGGTKSSRKHPGKREVSESLKQTVSTSLKQNAEPRLSKSQAPWQANPKHPGKPDPIRSDPIRTDPVCAEGPADTPHTAQVDETQSTDSPEFRQQPSDILEALRSHPDLASVANSEFAGTLEGRAMASGKRTAWVVAAIGDAAADVVSGMTGEAIRSKVRKYCDNARAPKVEDKPSQRYAPPDTSTDTPADRGEVGMPPNVPKLHRHVGRRGL